MASTEPNLVSAIEQAILKLERQISPENLDLINNWDTLANKYKDEAYIFKVRDKEIRIQTHVRKGIQCQLCSHVIFQRGARNKTIVRSSGI